VSQSCFGFAQTVNDVEVNMIGENPFRLAEEAAAALAERTGFARHDVMVVLGSGWGDAADGLGTATTQFSADELPGFVTPSALGHLPTIRSIDRGGVRVLAFLGRVHMYEGHEPPAVVHAVRTAAIAGCRVALLTNGAGFMNMAWKIGDPVLISDHLNLTGRSPLTGPNPPAPYTSRFCDLTDLYETELRDVVRTVRPGIAEGTYVGICGPHFETPAEIRAFHGMGAELVGMSTVLESIAARHMGMRVLGLSMATNPAAGFSKVKLDADDVISAGNAAAKDLGVMLGRIVDALAVANHINRSAS
jgi:purine-nucleoside phosphorylase